MAANQPPVANQAANPLPAVNLDQATIQGLVQNAVQAALGAALGATPATQAPVPPAFADNASGINDQLWDFSKGDGLKYYLNSTKGLEEKYDGKQDKLNQFLQAVYERAEAFGWLGVIRIGLPNNESRLLTESYGEVSEAQVRAHVTTCISALAGALGKRRQADTCLRRFINLSLDNDIKIRLQAKNSNITLVVGGNQTTFESGVMMLHQLISLIAVQTRSTVALLKKKLTRLDKVMEESKNDAQVFNDKVDHIFRMLRARGAAPGDVLTNLLDAHKMCEDTTFVTHTSGCSGLEEPLQEMCLPTSWMPTRCARTRRS